MLNLFALRERNIKNDVLSGITVALALVPEAVAFAFLAGVSPVVGLYSAFFLGLLTAVFGGRPGMISGATGAMAVVVVTLVAKYGIEYLFPTVMLCGLMQVLVGMGRLGMLIRMVPHSVVLGFVNGLAIVIFMTQLGRLSDDQRRGPPDLHAGAGAGDHGRPRTADDGDHLAVAETYARGPLVARRNRDGNADRVGL